jgi:hypothetical protein
MSKYNLDTICFLLNTGAFLIHDYIFSTKEGTDELRRLAGMMYRRLGNDMIHVIYKKITCI